MKGDVVLGREALAQRDASHQQEAAWNHSRTGETFARGDFIAE
jgi:hypothetical protein